METVSFSKKCREKFSKSFFKIAKKRILKNSWKLKISQFFISFYRNSEIYKNTNFRLLKNVKILQKNLKNHEKEQKNVKMKKCYEKI